MARDKKTEIVDFSKPLKNWQWEQFSQTYFATNSPTESALVANYSKKTARTQGSKLLTRVDIAGRIAYLQGELAKKSGVTAQRVIDEYAKIAFANIQDLLLEANHIRDISQVPREIAAAVSSVTVDVRHDSGPVEKGKSRGYVEKVKFTMHSKPQALDALGKHYGIFGADNDQSRTQVAIQIVNYAGASKK